MIRFKAVTLTLTLFAFGSLLLAGCATNQNGESMENPTTFHLTGHNPKHKSEGHFCGSIAKNKGCKPKAQHMIMQVKGVKSVTWDEDHQSFVVTTDGTVSEQDLKNAFRKKKPVQETIQVHAAK